MRPHTALQALLTRSHCPHTARSTAAALQRAPSPSTGSAQQQQQQQQQHQRHQYSQQQQSHWGPQLQLLQQQEELGFGAEWEGEGGWEGGGAGGVQGEEEGAGADIVGLLIGIFGSKDVFVSEYRCGSCIDGCVSACAQGCLLWPRFQE